MARTRRPPSGGPLPPVIDNPRTVSRPGLLREVAALNAATGDTLELRNVGVMYTYIPITGWQTIAPNDRIMTPFSARGGAMLALVRVSPAGELTKIAVSLNTRQMWWFLMGMRLEATGGFAFELDGEGV